MNRGTKFAVVDETYIRDRSQAVVSHVNSDLLLSLCRPKIQASEEMQH